MGHDFLENGRNNMSAGEKLPLRQSRRLAAQLVESVPTATSGKTEVEKEGGPKKTRQVTKQEAMPPQLLPCIAHLDSGNDIFETPLPPPYSMFLSSNINTSKINASEQTKHLCMTLDSLFYEQTFVGCVSSSTLLN